MATKMGQKRTTPQLPLKRRTSLKATKGLNRMSDKAKEELQFWLKVKAKRVKLLMNRYGYIPCEYCLKPIGAGEIFSPEGHHNNRNRRDNSPENCRILHRVCNQKIEDLNIRDVPSLL